MKIVLHAGMPKTGSSSIQTTLAANRDALRSQGVVYPHFGPANPGRKERLSSHWLLAANLLPDPSQFRNLSRKTAERRAEFLEVDVLGVLEDALAQAADHEVVLLSTENFGHEDSAPGLENRLLPLLKRFSPEIYCVAYARSPASLYPSSIQQKMKSGIIDNLVPSDWTLPHVARFEVLKRLFGDDFHLRVFDRRLLQRGDVVEDFSLRLGKIAGRELRLVKQDDENVSYSANACSIMFHFLRRRAPFNRDIYRELRVRLKAFDQSSPQRKLVIPDAWGAALSDKNAADWNLMVAFSRHTEREKESVFLQASGLKADIGDRDIVRHFKDVLDPAYVSGFVDVLRASGKENLANAVLRSIERLRPQDD